MVQLVELIPEADVVVALEPEELRLRMLPVLWTFSRSPGLQLQPATFSLRSSEAIKLAATLGSILKIVAAKFTSRS